MAITLTERDVSRPVQYGATAGTEVLKYAAKGTDNEVDLYEYVVANTPTILNGLVRRDIRLDPHGDDDRWDVDVEYGRTGQDGTPDALGATPTDPASNSPSTPGSDGATPSETPLGAGYSFDLTAETVHVTQSLKTLARVTYGAATLSGSDLTQTAVSPPTLYAPSSAAVPGDLGQTVWVTSGPDGWRPGAYRIVDVVGGAWVVDRKAATAGSAGGATWKMLPQAPDMGGAIGRTSEKIEGCDVYAARFEWSRVVTLAVVTRKYMLQLRDLVGKKNKDPFYGSAPGEVVYMGASGSFSVSDRWSITHKFSEIRNRLAVEVTPVLAGVDSIVIPHKRGWDHLWVSYREDQDDNRLVTVPDGAYLEEVIEDGDFDLIGIGR